MTGQSYVSELLKMSEIDEFKSKFYERLASFEVKANSALLSVQKYDEYVNRVKHLKRCVGEKIFK